MSDIEWTDETWNAVVGCSPAPGSEQGGCRECYATGGVHRFKKHYDRPGVVRLNVTNRDALTFLPRDPVTGKSLGKGAKWTGEVWLLPHALSRPHQTRKPTKWFVNSISDMFHESIVGCKEGRRFIAAMFAVMAATPQHAYQILTKRPSKAREWFEWLEEEAAAECETQDVCMRAAAKLVPEAAKRMRIQQDGPHDVWPLPNVWLGVSVESRATKPRIDALRELPAAVRFLSLEPLLEDLGELDLSGIDLAIAGGESGPKARPCDVGWIRSIVEQCRARAQGVPVFVKQLSARPVARSEFDLGPEAFHDYDCEHAGEPFPAGGYIPKLRSAKGGDMSEWPEDLRVREMPEVQP